VKDDACRIDYSSQRVPQRTPELALDCSIDVRKRKLNSLRAEPSSRNFASQVRQYRASRIGDSGLSFLRDKACNAMPSRQVVDGRKLAVEIGFGFSSHWRRLSHSAEKEAKTQTTEGTEAYPTSTNP
jgi:hypothetical protein